MDAVNLDRSPSVGRIRGVGGERGLADLNTADSSETDGPLRDVSRLLEGLIRARIERVAEASAVSRGRNGTCQRG